MAATYAHKWVAMETVATTPRHEKITLKSQDWNVYSSSLDHRTRLDERHVQPVRGRRSTRTFSSLLNIPTVGKNPPFGIRTSRFPIVFPFRVKNT